VDVGAAEAGALPAGVALFCIWGFNSAVARAAGEEGVWLDAWADVVLPVTPMAMAIATAATDNVPKIHGRRSLSSVIARLSSCMSVRAPNMTDC
jgi:hypothetical protein